VRKLVLAGLAVLAALLTGLLGGAVPAIGVQFPTIRPPQAVRPGITVSAYALGFNQISCSSASACLGLGLAVNPKTLGSQVTFAWNGTGWRKLALPAPAKGATAVDLTGVSCARDTKRPGCVAVGDYVSKSGDPGVFAVAWTGRALRLLPVPRPPKGVTDVYFDGLSCVSARHCVALGVGITTSNGAFPLLFETWNGTGWTVKTKDLPTVDDFPDLNGISCATSTDCATWCIAAGSVGTRVEVVAYNGRSWSAQRLPAPAKGYADDFGGISCVTEKSCVALGDIGPVKEDELDPLGARWIGKTWTLRVI
jgi:hypothetical protein